MLLLRFQKKSQMLPKGNITHKQTTNKRHRATKSAGVQCLDTKQIECMIKLKT